MNGHGTDTWNMKSMTAQSLSDRSLQFKRIVHILSVQIKLTGQQQFAFIAILIEFIKYFYLINVIYYNDIVSCNCSLLSFQYYILNQIRRAICTFH